MRNAELGRRIAALEKTVIAASEGITSRIAKLSSTDRASYDSVVAKTQAMSIEQFLNDVEPLPRWLFEQVYGAEFAILSSDSVQQAADRYARLTSP